MVRSLYAIKFYKWFKKNAPKIHIQESMSIIKKITTSINDISNEDHLELLKQIIYILYVKYEIIIEPVENNYYDQIKILYKKVTSAEWLTFIDTRLNNIDDLVAIMYEKKYNFITEKEKNDFIVNYEKCIRLYSEINSLGIFNFDNNFTLKDHTRTYDYLNKK